MSTKTICEICGKNAEENSIWLNKYITNCGWACDWIQGNFCQECRNKAKFNTNKNIPNISQFIVSERRKLKLKKLLYK